MSDDEIEELVIPADRTMINIGKALLNDNRVAAFANGSSTREGGYSITEPSGHDQLYRVYGKHSEGGVPAFLGIAAVENGSLVPRKVLI